MKRRDKKSFLYQHNSDKYSNSLLSAEITSQQTCADNETTNNKTINQCKKGG
jgi:hypothetical protein